MRGHLNGLFQIGLLFLNPLLGYTISTIPHGLLERGLMVMGTQGQSVYLDYLDYLAGDEATKRQLLLRLRYDLLLFADDGIELSVPACVKLDWITGVLMALNSFWQAGTFRLQLDAKHHLDPNHYFDSRVTKLERAMDEDKLFEHFEYSAYRSGRPEEFYSGYLSSTLQIDPPSLFVPKPFDTDALFRGYAVSEARRVVMLLVDNLSPQDQIRLEGALGEIETAALSGGLFQRALLIDRVAGEVGVDPGSLRYIKIAFDRAFARANAGSSGAIPVSFLSGRVTSKSLIPILRRAFPDLFTCINDVPWQRLRKLAQSEAWKDFSSTLDLLVRVASVQCGSFRRGVSKIAASGAHRRILLQLLDLMRGQAEGMAAECGVYAEYKIVERESMQAMQAMAGTGSWVQAMLMRLDYASQALQLKAKLLESDWLMMTGG